MQKSNWSATLCTVWLVYKLCVFTTQFLGVFFPFSINFHYFNPPVTFDARNWFLCSFAVYSYDILKPEENMWGQNIIPGKPEEQPANHLVIRAQHNLKCPVRIPGCLMNCAQCAVQGGTSRMEADGSSLRPQIPWQRHGMLTAEHFPQNQA